MLCCVPKKLADGGPFYNEAPFYDGILLHDRRNNNHLSSIREIQIEFLEEDAPPPILLPCAICARTFMPQSLEKHTRICERTAAKKRKPFDSAKQRIQGTELAEFLPKQEVRRHQDERTTRPSWKKTHDDFLRTIREARGEVMDSHKQSNSLISSGVPTRANEKGMCPTCHRQFGIKAYDRHVAWCKDRVTRVPVSPATNVAKERLEARMRYRAPALKNRRAINREKYSPGSAANQTAKTSVSSPALVKPKESIPSVNSNRESPVKQRPAAVRRPGQLKNSPTSSGPMKSRLADRMNRPEEDHDFLLTPTSCRSFHPATSCSLHFSVPSARPRINNPVSSNEIMSSVVSSRKQFNRNETIYQRIPVDDARNHEVCPTRMQKTIVSTRSQGHPRINDITVNDKTLGITVQPCKIHTDMQKDDQLVTWKQISRKKDNLQAGLFADYNFLRKLQLDNLDCLYDREERNENRNRMEEDSIAGSNRIDDKSKDRKIEKAKNDDVIWLDGIQNLNQTYLIKDSEDIELSEIFYSEWKPIKHSPRVEFYFKDRKDETCEFDQKKLKRKIETNDEKIEIKSSKQIKELEVIIKNEEDGETVVEVLKTNDENIENNRNMNGEKIEIRQNNENMKNNQNMNGEEIEVRQNENVENNRKLDSEEMKNACKTEEFNINSKYEENKRQVSYKEIKTTECNIEKIEINTEDTKETETIDSADIAELDKLNVYKEDEENRKIDIRIIESTKYIEETEQNLPEPEIVKSSSFDVMHSVAWNVSKNFIDQSQDCLNLKYEISQCENSCNNSFELKENAVTFICDQSNINDIPLNNNNNQANSNLEDETLACQSKSCRNSLHLTGSIKEISFATSCQSISPEKDCEKNAEETEIDTESYEPDLINLCNKKLKRNSERLNSEVDSFPRNLKVNANNHLNAPMNNIPVHIKNNKQYQKDFSFDNFENIENNTEDRKTDFYFRNTDSDNSCPNDKARLLRRSIIKTEVTTGEDLRKKNVNEFDYGNTNTTRVGEYNAENARGTNDLGSSVTSIDYAEESRRRGNEIFANVNFPRHAVKRTARERLINSIEMKQKIRENMNLLRGSTDSLISSVEFVELASIGRPETNRAYETIEVIRPGRRNKVSKDLPGIKADVMETREDSGRSYWERTSKVSRSRLTNLYPAYHAEYKFAKRNPRVRILPPVLNPPLINRRKIELATRPAWCNYVRRRPDFNLILKARTGTCKDYDPFLLAEQQMNDLLSDTSESNMGSSKVQQTRDTLYPLSHSSAFVKYPPSDRRSSLIAPPTEFDDLMSNFSSDSTETNSISREVFLKPDLAGKDAIDSISSKPVRELGRRIIIDKSKALGVDERRGVVVSADRPRKIFDKETPNNTRLLINRSNSIRASSAPRINSGLDRKTSGEIKKIQGSKIDESQRSSDQNLNQKNNNYSSLSGSNLSLSSIVSSSELDVKRSNSVFDELMTSFEEDVFPGLRSFLNNESFDLSSPGGDRQRNGSLISDEELSSPDSYKPQDHSKLSNDSAYSSLNRKYSHHGRSANDTIDRLDEDIPRNNTSPIQTMTKCKMSKFCHECGQRFPETAKYCCECGVRRLVL